MMLRRAETLQRLDSSSKQSLNEQLTDQILEARNAAEVLQVVQENGDKFNANLAATALHRLARHASTAQKPIGATESPHFEELLAIIDKHSGDMKHRDVAHIFWSLAKLDWCAPELLEKFAIKWQKKVGNSFHVKDVSDVLWACGRLGWFHTGFLEALLDNAVLCVPSFSESDVSNVLWALARLDCYDRPLMDKLAARSFKRIKKFRPQELTTMAWALATLRHDDPTLMAAIAGTIRAKVNDISSQDRCNLLWALATLGHLHRPLMVALSAVVLLRARQLSAVETANMLWACAMLGFEDRVLIASLSETVKIKSYQFQDPHWAQIYQAHLVFPSFDPGRTVLQKAREIWVRDTLHYKRASKAQAEIATMLQSVGIHVAVDYITADQEFCLDIALPDQKACFEINNTLHFTSNTARPLAHCRIRRRLIEGRGWRVLTVPTFIWEPMGKGEKQHYLGTLLQVTNVARSPRSMLDSKASLESKDSSNESTRSSQMRMSTEHFTRPVSSKSLDSMW